MNKNKISNEKQYKILFTKEKYVKWHEILTNGQNNFYIISTVIIFFVDVIIFIVIHLCLSNYFTKSDILMETINFSWELERSHYSIVNYYKNMMLYNMTMNELTAKYYANTEQKTIIDKIENSLYSFMIYSKKQSRVPNLYKDFCYFAKGACDCESLYNYYLSLKDGILSGTIETIEKDYKIYGLKDIFVQNCIESNLIIDRSPLPAFQSLYQKIINAIVSLNDFSYDGLIEKLFGKDFLIIVVLFSNSVQQISNILGRVSFTNARQNLIDFLDENIYLGLILYCVSEIYLILIFVLIYVWNMNNKCRNMWKLKRIFQITDLNKF